MFGPELVQVSQGFLQGEDTEYTINADLNGATTVQVIAGPVVFLDPITNNTITIQTNQMLTLPAAQPNGFSNLDLQNDVSTSNSASTSQWWTQGTANTSSSDAFMGVPLILLFAALAIIIAVVAVLSVVMSRRKVRSQIYASGTSGPNPPQQANRSNQKWSKSSNPLSKKKLIGNAVGLLVFITIFGYILTNLFNSLISSEQQLGTNVATLTTVENVIIIVLVLGYVGSLVSLVRRYRMQNSKMPPPLPIQRVETRSPSFKMAAENSVTISEQPKLAFCPNCGKQLPVAKTYCPFCGFAIRKQDSNVKN